jgi:EAL domain-containing protein (putative c-di-GMP-specific phosphodiesterase class I)
VELTERQALTDLGRAAIGTARSLGIAVALDDFGTGHSGLSQFVGLDLVILKIDRRLLMPILENRTAARMLRGIVGLAAALRLRTAWTDLWPGRTRALRRSPTKSEAYRVLTYARAGQA